jgi:hypothetical protein
MCWTFWLGCIKRVKFQVLMAASMNIRAFWDIGPWPTFQRCLHRIHRPDDEVSTHLWNVGVLHRDYTAQYSRRLQSSYLKPVLGAQQIRLCSFTWRRKLKQLTKRRGFNNTSTMNEVQKYSLTRSFSHVVFSVLHLIHVFIAENLDNN